MENKIKIGITQGDINGVSYEIIIKALADNYILETCTPIIYGSTKAAAFHRKNLDVQSFNLNTINTASEASHRKINIINCTSDEIKVEIAQETESAGEAALNALELATQDLKAGLIDVLLTAPINRKNLNTTTKKFLGHSEYLEEKFEAPGKSLMLLVSDVMRVAILTGHTPISEVAGKINKALIIDKVKTLNKILKEDFAIVRPRIAVLGLNPHAGSEGKVGTEEAEIIIPALKELQNDGIVCVGPLEADGFFGSGHFTKFDAVLAMYHDQGMIPFKAVSMDIGVNYTANLPYIRTAPIHDAQYEIAGQNLASEESFSHALHLACDMYKNRLTYKEITANPLKFSKQESNYRDSNIG